MVTPAVVELDLPPQQRSVEGLRVSIPAGYIFRYPRVAIAADVTFDGHYLGQISEATVERAA